MTLREAVQYAVRVRLRPLLMTSLATIIGLLRILVLLLVIARSAPAEIYHHPGTAARRVKNRISIPDRLTLDQAESIALQQAPSVAAANHHQYPGVVQSALFTAHLRSGGHPGQSKGFLHCRYRWITRRGALPEKSEQPDRGNCCAGSLYNGREGG